LQGFFNAGFELTQPIKLLHESLFQVLEIKREGSLANTVSIA
jgi:hypothetical protein